MKKVLLNLLLVLTLPALLSGCIKKRKYDDAYRGDRDYALTFDHIEVVNETETANVNGKLDVVEKATLNIYLKNEGPDPCLFNTGTFGVIDQVAGNGFYITNSNIDEVIVGDPASDGKTIQYIDPGETDYIAIPVRTYEYLQPNQELGLYLDLVDYDEDVHHLVFSIHIE
jgi:hypothetical protein